MSTFERFSDRHYYETKFMEEELPLWIWESGTNYRSKAYQFTSDGRVVEDLTWGASAPDWHANMYFKPYQWFTDESTPNYFVIDLYAISTGGYASYRNHKRRYKHYKYKYDDYYSSGGSGGCVYMQNVKLRIRDEDLKGITYAAYGLGGPVDGAGGNYDWDIPPKDKNNDPGDFCIKLGGDYRTPNGVAPAGTIIFGMGVGGNAYQDGHPTSPGHGCSVIYIPEQCAFLYDINDLPTYDPGTSYTPGSWINYAGKAYKILEAFTATSWSNDSRFCSVAPTYNASTTYKVGDYLYYQNKLYKVEKEFQGDEANTILGIADYFLDKSEKTFHWQHLGNDGKRVKDSPHTVPAVPPTRYFNEGDINDLNEFWVRKSLSWGQGQGIGSGRKGYWGQPGGIAMIYKGESS